MSLNNNPGNYSRLRIKKPKAVSISARKERNLSIKKVSLILQKDESVRTKEEKELLFNYSEIVKEAGRRIEKRKQLKERLQEVEDSEPVLDAKCKQLAEAVSKAEYLVVYTGAGISTAARIPDYRGASGIWTLLQQGKDIGTHDLTQADPTYTHMALFQLYVQGKVKHIVSQNCDGLHLRSGLPKRVLSEVHGNMYIEVCKTCKPIIEYLRLFDVTENTGRYSHRTMRKCYKCNSSLVDSIVHFGERGNLPWPLNWTGACKAAEKADMILCIGSSLKVLKRYPWLWCMDKPVKRRPHIYIVNLQWTPKDCQATMKINGKCDVVMEKLMKYLAINVPKYSRKFDPIFEHATDLCKEELHTKNRPFLMAFKQEKLEHCCSDSNTKIKKEELDSDWETAQKIIKSDHESCVTSCKKEILIDTGQGRDVKPIKEEFILITIRSGLNFKDCCDLFKINQMHNCECPNFIDEHNDIPVIIQDDLVVLKNGSVHVSEGNLGSLVKSELPDLEEKVQCYHTSEKNGNCESFDLKKLKSSENLKEQNFQDNKGKDAKVKNGHEIAKSESNNKKPKLFDDNNVQSNNFLRLSRVCSSVLELKYEKEVNIKCNQPEESLKQKGTCAAKCLFCWERYSSGSCLFYGKRKPGFKGTLPVCDCCSSDDEDEGNETCDEKNCESQMSTNPGWYGKGLRKNVRKKRSHAIMAKFFYVLQKCRLKKANKEKIRNKLKKEIERKTCRRGVKAPYRCERYTFSAARKMADVIVCFHSF